MNSPFEDDERLKRLLKAAMLEVLEERKELLQEAITEALEDVALSRAIEEGLSTKTVGREEVFHALEGER
ncbi:MAG: hypothetical protein ACLQOO_19320 [Terriglobia bacterium]